MEFIVSQRILRKLKEKPNVCWDEVEECFMNEEFGFLEDIREEHKTVPPTLWFIAATDKGRRLKVIFIEKKNGVYEIKSAYPPNKKSEKLYEKNIQR